MPHLSEHETCGNCGGTDRDVVAVCLQPRGWVPSQWSCASCGTAFERHLPLGEQGRAIVTVHRPEPHLVVLWKASASWFVVSKSESGWIHVDGLMTPDEAVALAEVLAMQKAEEALGA